MTPDGDLPVWSIRPNWRQAILERLEWLTGIGASTIGVEQSTAFRLSPRRSFEAYFSPKGDVRSYFDLWLHRFGHFEFMLPLWHDQGKLTDDIDPGATTIPVNTNYREFRPGDYALLTGDTPHWFDRPLISAVTATELTVTGINRSWPAGTKIHPLRRARLSQESQVALRTRRLGEGTLLFELNQENDIEDEGEWDGLVYGDHPVMLLRPNRRDQIDTTYIRNRLLVDGEQGIRAISDEAGRAFTIQNLSFMMQGRADHWSFRQMLYRLRGMQGAVWLPTHADDIVLSAAALSTDDFIDIRQIGYEYSGGVTSGRDHILLNGEFPVQIDSVGAEPSSNEERLILTADLGENLPAGTVGSFLDTCRLSNDIIEITHHTDTDGTAECSLAFRSFLDAREEGGVNHYPIEEATPSELECGEMPSDPCSETPYNGPLVIEITIPNPLPEYTDSPAWDSYFQLYMSLSVESPSGVEFQTDTNGFTLFNADANNPPPSQGPIVRSVYDPVCDQVGYVTINAEITPGLVTITAEIDNPYFKFAPNWEEPDPGDTTWWDHPYEYGDWIGINIIGNEPLGWTTGSFSPTATVTLDGVTAPSATSHEMWYVAASFPAVHNALRFRCVPTSEMDV